jgi:hypothetical protein
VRGGVGGKGSARAFHSGCGVPQSDFKREVEANGAGVVPTEWKNERKEGRKEYRWTCSESDGGDGRLVRFVFLRRRLLARVKKCISSSGQGYGSEENIKCRGPP